MATPPADVPTSSRRRILWALSLVLFVCFYLVFGGGTVEGDYSTLVFVMVVDVVVLLLMVFVPSAVIALALALVLRRECAYLARVADLLPIVLSVIMLLLIVLGVVVDSTGGGPVR